MSSQDRNHLGKRGIRLSRRRFLTVAGAAMSTAWAVPTIVLPRFRGANRTVAASDRVNMAMIGLGRQAITHNLPVFVGPPIPRSSRCATWTVAAAARENPALVAVASGTIRARWAERMFPHDGLPRGAGSPDVDAVMITTPDHSHVPVALAAIKAGKGMGYKKPIGLCIAHGRLLANAAAQSKCVFRTDSEFRSIPTFFKAVSLVRTGKMGKSKTVPRMAAPGLEHAAPHAGAHAGPAGAGLRDVAGAGPCGAVYGKPGPSAKGLRRVLQSARLVRKSNLLRRRDIQLGPSPHVAQWGNDSKSPVRWKSRPRRFSAHRELWNVIAISTCGVGTPTGWSGSTPATGRGGNAEACMYDSRGLKAGSGVVRTGPAESGTEVAPTAEVKPEDFPFQLEDEKLDFLDCVKTRGRMEDAEVGHRSTSLCQLAYIACSN